MPRTRCAARRLTCRRSRATRSRSYQCPALGLAEVDERVGVADPLDEAPSSVGALAHRVEIATERLDRRLHARSGLVTGYRVEASQVAHHRRRVAVDRHLRIQHEM